MRVRFSLCLVVFALCAVRGLDVAVASQPPEIVCGQVVRVSEGSRVPTRAIYLRDRLQYLQRTMRTLLQSGGLQVVALGDSIIGDTFGPQNGGVGPHLGGAGGTDPIAQYFSATIWAGVAIRGSTGAWYYHLPGQVQVYVLVYQPDLVIIGGISNVVSGVTNQDAFNDIQDVINQIRAAQPQTEFILMTGAVDLQAVPQSVNLDLDQADPGSYEVMLRALAEQVGAGFIDMRHSYSEFVMESNAENPSIDQAYFQRDAIHANFTEGLPLLHELTDMFFRPVIQCADRAAARAALPNPPPLTLLNINRNLPAVTAVATPAVNNNGHPALAYFSQTQPGTLLLAGIDSPTAVQLGSVPLNKSIFADLDGVGPLDLVGIDANGSVRLLFASQTGSPFSATSASTVLAGAAAVTNIAVFDANQDARNDILVALNGGAALRLYLNEGGATPFTAPTIVDLPVLNGSTQQLLIADVNHDGLPDIVELRSGPAPGNTHLIVRINSGPPDFFPLSSTFAVPLGSIAPTTMAVADLDGDSKVDLVVGTAASDDYIYVFPNSGRNGTWFFDPLRLAKSTSGACTVSLRIADVDGDGRPDIVSANGCATNASAVDFYGNTGVISDFQTIAPKAFATGLANTDLALADLHSSGQPDVIVAGIDPSGIGAIVEFTSYVPPPPPPNKLPSQPRPTPPAPSQQPPPVPTSDPPAATATGASHGGGGALGVWDTIALALLTAMRVFRRARRPEG
jgi:lysophospholipase L1-like esterase